MSVNSLKNVLSSKDTASLHHFMESIHVNMGKEEYEKSIVSEVNNLLTNSKTRLMGLEMVQFLIVYCSHDTLSENVLNWANYCMVHHAEDSGREVKLNTLEKILEKTGDMEFFTKKFSTDYLNTTLKACLVYQNNAEKIASLKCLIQCMRRYPSWFGNHKQKIEPFLIKSFESNCQTTAEWAAVAFLCFLETGPAGVNSINYINNFSSYLKKLCATIQLLYNTFFKDFPEINNSVNIDGDVFNELTGGFTPENASEVISNRIINCLILLKTLITKKFSVEKRIVPKYIFDIISRGLSAHVCTSEVAILTVNSHSTFLRKIQIYLFTVFAAVIQGFQSTLLPFAAVIENTLLNSLQRTSKCDCFSFDKTYKICIYKILIKWLTTSKVINDSHFQHKLIPMILEDISPVKKTTVLNVDKSGKKKLKLNDNTNRKALISDVIAENNCIHALETLKCLLATSFSVNQTILKDLVIFVTKTLDDIQVGKTASPYSNINCQVKLYEVFISFFHMENFQILLSSMHSVVNVLNRGQKSRNLKISRVSSVGLELLEKICQPVCSSIDICDLQVSLNENRHISYDLLENRDKLLENGGEKHEKEIRIISNIVINKPHDEEQAKNDDLVVSFEVTEKMEMETEIRTDEVPETVILDEEALEDDVEKTQAMQNRSEDSEDKIPEAVDKIVEEESVTYVLSDNDVDNGVDDMACSFVDVVQE